MHSQQFDVIVRSISTGTSRRRLFAGLTSGLLALLRAPGGEDAHGRKKRKKKRKKKQNQLTAAPGCASTCAGCCDGSGVCQPGTTATTCGSGGAACVVCAGPEACTSGRCLVPACGSGGTCRVFVTSTTYDGNLGGLSGADQKCQERAQAAGLPGTYLAWLSDRLGNSPSTRFAHASGPYQRVDGVTVANNWADLTDGLLGAPINVMELRTVVGDPTLAWTHTLTSGAEDQRSSSANHCLHWSTNDTSSFLGDTGSAIHSGLSWTQYGPIFCSHVRRLYCFQQS